MWRWPLLVAVAAAAMAACGSGGNENAKSAWTVATSAAGKGASTGGNAATTGGAVASPGTTGVPAGWNVGGTNRFTVLLPPGWMQFQTDQGKVEETTRQLAASNPQLAQQIEQQRQSGRLDSFLLYAVDARSTGTFAPNVNVVYMGFPSPRAAADLLQEGSKLLSTQVPGLTVTTTRADLKVTGRDAAELRFTYVARAATGGALNLAGVQFFVVDGSGVYTLTVTGFDTPEFIPLAERVGMSFEPK